ncbi:MAG: TetR/AcrR family transcriptional regulator [Prevotella sp.]|nr:TetR/AcrR family transcriptional regulator [Prevotella sp.]
MQTQKDEIRRLILLVARDEFLANGVRHTSMKTIAAKAGVSVGNIYNYYCGKDELLKAVLAPLFKAFKEYQMKNLCEDYTTLDLYRYDLYYEMMREQVSSLVIPYRKELCLLIFDTAGTSLENSFSQFLDKNYEDGQEYIARMKALHPHINADVSPHFIRILCELWAGLIKSIILRDDISSSDLDRIISNYVRFGIGGWKSLMGIE